MPPVSRRSQPLTVRRSVRARVVPKENVVDLREPISPLEPRAVQLPPPVPRPPMVDVPAVLGRASRGLPLLTRARLAAALYNGRSVVGFTVASAAVVLLVSFGRGVGAAATDAAVAQAQASQGIAALHEASAAFSEQRWRDAASASDRATGNFEAAENALGSVPTTVRWGLAMLPTGRRFTAARHLASAGRFGSEAASMLAGFADRNLAGGASPQAFPALLGHADELIPALDATDRALDEFSAADPSAFSGDVGASLRRLSDALPTFRALSREARTAVELLPRVLGSDQPQEYLVLFQNAAERRPTGGFFGSLLGVRLNNGVPTVTDAPGRGPFDVDDLLPPITPPNPILRVTNRWTLHDSNWSPDFPTAAQKALSFYEEARGYKVDGVIAITSTLLPQLLNIVGPLTLPDGTVLTSDTALSVLQDRVEQGYNHASNQPKGIVGPLFVALSDRIRTLPPRAFSSVLSVLRESIPTRAVQIFRGDTNLEAQLKEAGWSGTVTPGSFDTLGIIGANLGGGKSDRVIDDNVLLTTAIDKTGTVEDTVTYVRTHRGVPADPLAGLTNRTYVRFFTPAGSTLNTAQGFTAPDPGTFFAPADGVRPDADAAAASAGILGPDGTRINDELGMTSFGNWFDLPAQTTASVRVDYTLAKKLAADGIFSSIRTYRLHLIHQGGTSPSVLFRLDLPRGAKPVLSSITLSPRDGGFEGSLLLDRDTDITVLYR